jgi:hypothetical protein
MLATIGSQIGQFIGRKRAQEAFRNAQTGARARQPRRDDGSVGGHDRP